VRSCRLASFAPTHVSWLACRPGSPSRSYTHPPKLRQGPADGVGSCNWPHGVRAELPFVRCLDLASAANEPSEMVRSPGVGSPSAVLSLSLCNQIAHVVGGPKTSSLLRRSARLRGDSHGGRNIGEAQVEPPQTIRAKNRLNASRGRRRSLFVCKATRRIMTPGEVIIATPSPMRC